MLDVAAVGAFVNDCVRGGIKKVAALGAGYNSVKIYGKGLLHYGRDAPANLAGGDSTGKGNLHEPFVQVWVEGYIPHGINHLPTFLMSLFISL